MVLVVSAHVFVVELSVLLSLVCIATSNNGGFFCLKLVLNWSLLREEIHLSGAAECF